MSTFAKTRLSAFLVFCCIFLYSSVNALAETSQFDSPSLLNASPFRTKIYFYNPEISTARNLVLKNTWDNYLHEAGEYEFQPVDDEAEFIRLVEGQNDAAFIMAEWFYSSLFSSVSKEKGLGIAFQGVRNGKDTYTKILIANKSTLDLEATTIACSGSKARARAILGSIYPELSALQLNKLKLLLVPKDIDALMAVGYGLADMALSTETGLTKMSRLNENLYKDMVIVRESKPLKRSVLVFKSTNSVLKRRLAHLIMNMNSSASGRQAVNLLGLDEWQAKPALSVYLSNMVIEVKTQKGGLNNDH